MGNRKRIDEAELAAIDIVSDRISMTGKEPFVRTVRVYKQTEEGKLIINDPAPLKRNFRHSENGFNKLFKKWCEKYSEYTVELLDSITSEVLKTNGGK